MSSEHAAAVRNSNLYEYKGVAKSLLERIADLILDAEGAKLLKMPEGQGWCVASQKSIAAWHGISVDTVSALVETYEADGWLTVKRFHDDRGYLRCWYTITKEQLAAIKARKMARDANDDPIRGSMPSRGRRKSEESRRNSLGNLKPFGKKSVGSQTSSPEAIRQQVCEPFGKKSVYGSALPFLPDGRPNGSGEEQKQPQTPAPLCSEGKKGQGKSNTPALPGGNSKGNRAPRRPSPSARVPLKAAVRSKLVSFGCPLSVLEMLEAHTQIATILNGDSDTGCSDPVKAYLTMCDRNPSLPFAALWKPKVTSFGTIDYSDASHEAAKREREKELREMTPEEREEEQAIGWWTDYGVRDAIYARKAVVMKKDRHGNETNTYDVVAMWHRDRETCNSWTAKQWREKRDKKNAAA